MRFQVVPPQGGQEGILIDLNYSPMIYSRWLFDEISGRYLRFQDIRDSASPGENAYAFLQDRLTGETVATDNVVILIVPHSYFAKTATTEIIQIHLDGFGGAILFRDGLACPAIWVNPAGGVLSLYSLAGNPVPFKPGKTFFQVLGDTSLQPTDQGHWQFDFQIP